MNICIVAGARPNFIKVAPIVRAIDKAKEQGRDIDFKLVYAGTSDDSTLESSLFEDLQIRRPDVFLEVGCENLNELTGQVMSAFELYLQQNPTDVVIVVDDLASTMAAAIVTKKQGILLAHLVAGTRSFDIRMPKEINRLVIDGLSDLLFTAGMGSQSIATREGAELSKIYLVGNILMDTLRFNYNRLKKPLAFDALRLKERGYLVFTLNRKALIKDTDNLQRMLSSLIANAHGMPIVAPLRGRAEAAIRALHIEVPNFHLIAPLGYLEFGYLTAHAKGIITDSGNVAEEATFNSVPCITLNSYTEHIETVKVGSNVLVGEDADKLGAAVADMVADNWKKCAIPDRWDGRSAERIVQILLEFNHSAGHL
ncbi:UDP-N-acetyl glucosamine 2-epimerase [Prevotella sp. KH2C16]|uniref:UDP-N-acetyl glucosamine 2-epimerase n=1 Tax=Prevotella sp. KH2C16 TaxID=1855325 RepID=UPI0008E6B2F9|nr:UDP-N-acetyl glucosamine 2-epimerase [Prevotella sp. KH2C16]SFF92423.1 UDP-N-acetylglucosamine 2-epimerase (non-hydrolysing) [Prevotella sp. KH2C16]